MRRLGPKMASVARRYTAARTLHGHSPHNDTYSAHDLDGYTGCLCVHGHVSPRHADPTYPARDEWGTPSETATGRELAAADEYCLIDLSLEPGFSDEMRVAGMRVRSTAPGVSHGLGDKTTMVQSTRPTGRLNAPFPAGSNLHPRIVAPEGTWTLGKRPLPAHPTPPPRYSKVRPVHTVHLVARTARCTAKPMAVVRTPLAAGCAGCWIAHSADRMQNRSAPSSAAIAPLPSETPQLCIPATVTYMAYAERH